MTLSCYKKCQVAKTSCPSQLRSSAINFQVATATSPSVSATSLSVPAASPVQSIDHLLLRKPSVGLTSHSQAVFADYEPYQPTRMDESADSDNRINRLG